MIKTLENLAPPWLTPHPGEERGLVFGRKTDVSSIVIRKVVVSVDPTIECIDAAVASKAGLIISHHPLSNAEFFKIRELAFEKMRLLTENNIWVYTTGDPWIHAPEGITESMCQALRLEPDAPYMITNDKGDAIPVGRVVATDGTTKMGAIIDRAKAIAGRGVISYKGKLENTYKKALVMGGRIDNIKPVIKALEDGVDLLIAGELSSEIVTILSDLRIHFIVLSHHETDILGMSKLRGLLSLKHPNVTFTLHDESPVQHV